MAEPSRDILNALLDQIEGAVELVERHGGGAALRARLARLLPAEEGATVRTTAAAGGPAEGGPENRHAGGMAEPSSIEHRLALAKVLTALRVASARRLSDGEARAVSEAKRWVMDELKLCQGDAA